MSSTWGKILKLTLFGESHGPAVGLALDGLPAGRYIDVERLRSFMQRRSPGRTDWMSGRCEEDEPVFLSGLNDGYTCGSPLAALIKNSDARAEDYRNLQHIPRPGHADFTAQARYGEHTTLAGGGHLSGRLTAPLCLAGGIAIQILEKQDIFIGAHIYAISDIEDSPYDPVLLDRKQLLQAAESDFPVNDHHAGARMQKAIRAAREDGDSLGGVIESAVLGLPPGLGSPPLGGVENRLTQLLFAIPALTALEFGAGFAATRWRGSQNNDPFIVRQGQICTATNHHGGVLGGISSGMPLIFKVAIKPTPSISREQRSVDMKSMRETTLRIEGRHDPCIVPRAVPCVESAAALILLDMILEQGKI